MLVRHQPPRPDKVCTYPSKPSKTIFEVSRCLDLRRMSVINTDYDSVGMFDKQTTESVLAV